MAAVFFRSCYYHFAIDRQESYTSPHGINAIIVRYDLASRPIIYKKGLLWNRKIWEYSGPGFMETVFFDVKWIAENEIDFSYDDKNDAFDEEFTILIP
jgi:hypothetical protein